MKDMRDNYNHRLIKTLLNFQSISATANRLFHSLSHPFLFPFDTLASNSACKGGSDGLVVKEV